MIDRLGLGVGVGASLAIYPSLSLNSNTKRPLLTCFDIRIYVHSIQMQEPSN